MDDKEKIYALMAHTEDLQKIVEAQAVELEKLRAEALGTIRAGCAEVVRAGTSDVRKAFKEIEEVVRKSAKEAEQCRQTLGRSMLWQTTILTCLVGAAIVGIFSGIIWWQTNAFVELRMELEATRTELSKTAQIITVKGKTGYFVVVDGATIQLSDGRLAAPLPKP